MKHKRLNITFIIISFIALMSYVLYSEGLTNLKNGFLATNHFILVVAFSLIVIYWVLESIILHIIIKAFYPKQSFRATFKTSMIGQFFNCLTPFASGGQPMQAYSLLKSGVPLGISSCSLLIKFIIYQLTLTVYSIIALVFKFSYFSQKIEGFKYLIILGFIINTVIVFALLSVFFFKNFTLKAGRVIARLLHKIKIVKDIDCAYSKLDVEINEFYNSFTLLKQNIPLVLNSAILSALQLTVFFLIPYALAVAFKIKENSIIDMISAQSFVTMITSFVPLPGGSGGAEFSFLVLFNMFFDKFVSFAMLLWRLITFYLPIAVGIFFVFNPKERKFIDEEMD